MSKRFLNIAPTNAGTGVFSFSGAGNPQIIFNIADVGLLQAHELRFQGTFKIVDNTTGALLVPTADVNVDAFTGVQSAIQTLNIASRNYSNRSLEEILQYSRLVSSVQSTLHDKADFDCTLSHEAGSKGMGFDTVAELNANGNTGQEYSAVGQRLASRIPYCAVGGKPFSMRLICGTLMSMPMINLNDLGGATITITLAPTSNVLWGANASGYNYQILNPRLVVPILLETPAEQIQSAQNPTADMQFLSFTSLYNTINSTAHQVVHKTSLRGVISTLQNYVPTGYINNFTENGVGQYNPQIRRLTYHIDGKRFPLEYSLEPERLATFSESEQPTTTPQILTNYVDALKNFQDVKKSCINPTISSAQQQVERNAVWGTGCSYDAVSQAGIPAVLSTLGFEIQSNLLDPADFATAPSANPAPISYSVYSYYLCRNSVRITKGQGMEVVS
jgi:hypothetical protein